VIPNPLRWPLADQSPWISPTSVGFKGARRILAVGRLERVKGYEKLIEAFASVAKRCADWELVILGDGSLRGELLSAIRALDLSRRVFLPGQVGNLRDWYGSAEFLVMTSQHEGFPNVLLEAMACGVPVVAFDCDSGPRNIIRDGIDGLLVADQDVLALIAAMARLIDDADFRRQLGRRCEDVRERFGEARVAGLWRRLLLELVDGKAA
jgi:glycosyltransferase involved in cell wall biosynthesis